MKTAFNSVTLGAWSYPVSEQGIVMSMPETDVLKEYAMRWIRAFPYSDTLAWREFRVPSVIIRFDYIVDEYGVVRIYEIEDRTSGFGVFSLLSGVFRERLRTAIGEIRSIVGPVSIYVSQSRLQNSDDLHVPVGIFDRVVCEPEDAPQGALWVRANRDEVRHYHLERRSVSTISHEGLKGYGVRLGLWKEIDGELPFDRPFVLKPEAGCRTENMYIWTPDRKSSGGYDTRTKILRAYEEGSVRYIQEFHKPETHDFLPPEYRMMRRAMFAWNPRAQTYVPLGGIWLARPNCVKLHGAKDAVHGPLIVGDE